MARPQPIHIPDSYASLPLQQIKISHVPESSPTATPVILLTLNRPKNNNAFTDTMMQEIEASYHQFNLDERVKCIVVTGAGRMFCAGADLDIGFPGGKGKGGGGNKRIKETDQEHRDGGGRAVLAIHHCRKPTIMAVNGSAVGIGATMQLPAAIRLATATAKIGFVFSRRGLVMEACSSYFLPRLIGFSQALHLTTTGLAYPATSPLLSNLYSEILPTPEATLARALEIAEDVAKNTSVLTSYLMREMMWRDAGSAEGQHLLDSRVIHGLFGGRENEEGIKSFFEKRSPVFRGTLEEDAMAYYPWWQEVNVGSRAAVANRSKL